MTTLRDYMNLWYDNSVSCLDALNELQDDVWLHSMGWQRVFCEGIGDGVYSPKEGIVVIFDEDDLPQYHEYCIYDYNPNDWKSCEMIV